ncbi:Pre-mRNA-splicing factor cwf19 [Dimargaris verticillata]|uniref:Pre-mRNA-splicing factor cwf19 n=1 Tax=Dimargaris verticillata TaxID=2761393 RepID=A0A9W8B9X6_9FUNG|nr:Pre-mRNA-splicing factor cwf19 [Dimargaris verticillata]
MGKHSESRRSSKSHQPKHTRRSTSPVRRQHSKQDRQRHRRSRNDDESRSLKNQTNPQAIDPRHLDDLESLWVEKAPATDQSNPAATSASTAAMHSHTQTIVTLPNFDDHGRPLNLDQDPLLTHLKSSASTSKRERRKQDRVSAMDEGQGNDILSMLHQEKYGNEAGSDFQMAKKILRDAKFEDNLEYLDDNADRLAKTHHGLNDQQKRNIAIQDYRGLVACPYCFQAAEDTSAAHAAPQPPQIPVVSIGTQVYLGLPSTEPLVPGHCLIVPLQHTVSTLTCEDDAWTEIRNFMKCLLQAFHFQGKGVVFMETVMEVTPRKGRHTAIECLPIPEDLMDDLPAFFREALLSADDEWTQHRKVLDTSLRATKVSDLPSVQAASNSGTKKYAQHAVKTGGFRKSLTAKVPYFHVWLDLDGGLGHVIENPRLFPHYLGKEIIAGMLDLPPRLYRRPTKLPTKLAAQRQRAKAFRELAKWDAFDWTKLLDQ